MSRIQCAIALAMSRPLFDAFLMSSDIFRCSYLSRCMNKYKLCIRYCCHERFKRSFCDCSLFCCIAQLVLLISQLIFESDALESLCRFPLGYILNDNCNVCMVCFDHPMDCKLSQTRFDEILLLRCVPSHYVTAILSLHYCLLFRPVNLIMIAE